MLLKNARIFTGERLIDGYEIEIQGETIANINESSISQGIDMPGLIIVPGYIDLQVNGGGGYLFNDKPTVATIEGIYSAHRRFGTTALCPTFITDSMEKLQLAINSVSRCDSDKIPAIHIEGFFISKEKCGIHNKGYIRSLTEEDIQIISSGDCKKLLTLAPEVNDFQLMEQLAACGIILLAGHSNSDFDCFSRFLNGCGSGATHLYNAMSGLTGRNPGAIGAVLNSEVGTAGIIVDGHHVDYACVEIANKMLGDRLYFVSDAMPPACSDIRDYVLYGMPIKVENKLCVSGNGTIAGSCIALCDCVKNAVEHCHIPLEAALKKASLIPAKVLGIDNRFGRINKGYVANLTILNSDLNPVATVVKGELAYH